MNYEQLEARVMTKWKLPEVEPMTDETEAPWPDLLKVRDAKVHYDLGGSGRRIYTTAGSGYERKEYIRKDLSDAKDKRIEELEAERDHYAVLYSKECDTYSEMRIKVDELEAKLDKAEAYIDSVGSNPFLSIGTRRYARATIAELKGEPNDH